MDRNLIRGDTDDETELVRASVDRAYEPGMMFVNNRVKHFVFMIVFYAC